MPGINSLLITLEKADKVEIFKACCILVTNKSIIKCWSVLWFLWNSCTSSQRVVDRVSIESFDFQKASMRAFFTYILVIIAESLVKSLSIVQRLWFAPEIVSRLLQSCWPEALLRFEVDSILFCLVLCLLYSGKFVQVSPSTNLSSERSIRYLLLVWFLLKSCAMAWLALAGFTVGVGCVGATVVSLRVLIVIRSIVPLPFYSEE